MQLEKVNHHTFEIINKYSSTVEQRPQQQQEHALRFLFSFGECVIACVCAYSRAKSAAVTL
jgi:hypothetical protein